MINKYIFCILLFLITSLYSIGQQNINFNIGGKNNGPITYSEITEAKRISADNDSIRIVSFSLSGIIDGIEQNLTVNSDVFSEDCYTLLKKLLGKKFYIENVKGILLNGTKVSLGSNYFDLSP